MAIKETIEDLNNHYENEKGDGLKQVISETKYPYINIICFNKINHINRKPISYEQRRSKFKEFSEGCPECTATKPKKDDKYYINKLKDHYKNLGFAEEFFIGKDTYTYLGRDKKHHYLHCNLHNNQDIKCDKSNFLNGKFSAPCEYCRTILKHFKDRRNNEGIQALLNKTFKYLPNGEPLIRYSHELTMGKLQKLFYEEFELKKKKKKINIESAENEVIDREIKSIISEKLKVTLVCNKHNDVYSQKLSSIKLEHTGCDKCRSEQQSERVAKHSISHFRKKLSDTYEGRYIMYPEKKQVQYGNKDTEMKFLCLETGQPFWASYHQLFFNKSGCDCCKNGSIGERSIDAILKKIHLKPYAKREYSFEELPRYSFDFFISKYQLLIEYDGEYHFKTRKDKNNAEDIDGEKRLAYIQQRDRVKNEFIRKWNLEHENNYISFIRISYEYKAEKLMTLIKEIILKCDSGEKLYKFYGNAYNKRHC